MTHAASPASTSELGLRSDLENARDVATIGSGDNLHVRVAQGRDNIWLALSLDGADVAYLRLGPNAGELSHVQAWSKPDGTAGCAFTTPLGPMRAKIAIHEGGIVRCTSSLLPVQDTRLTEWPRDLYAAAPDGGVIHTNQRGLRSGIVYASGRAPRPHTVFYFQNFSALNAFFAATKRTPADTVGGVWPEMGYAPPTGDDCVLPRAQELVVSDAFVALSAEFPESEETIAALYLDQLAAVYTLLEKPTPEYHDWAQRAQSALRDLSASPLCTYVRQGRRYLMPYVADETKPPESMVQFTVAVNAGEFDAWRNEESALSRTLRATVPHFFDDEVGACVRWLPGEPFDDAQADDNMNHDAMDSWYLHHALFNALRIAHEGDAAAKDVVKKSLPFLVRVARRFDYNWPIFFHLRTLDVIRAEAKPGEGGETDVAGLYALVMLHAYEMFGDNDYLAEAETAVAHLRGFGFNLAYQLNTTGFAAEAALRLWTLTKKSQYLALSTTCLANVFDNLWLWQCDYGNALHYRTFFGLFPLRDAPYVAPYEELEAQAKFHGYLELGGDDVRPSVKLLAAEFQKYALDRCWYYYPDALPVDVVAEKARNGRIERALNVPLEDLQDGLEKSGQVGQEIYGAGLPFVMTSRHYQRLEGTGMIAFCDYPMFNFTASASGGSWRVGGDPRGSCTLRVFVADVSREARSISVTVDAGSVRVPVRGTLSAEGHAVFSLRGGQSIDIRCAKPAKASEHSVVVGSMAAEGAH